MSTDIGVQWQLVRPSTTTTMKLSLPTLYELIRKWNKKNRYGKYPARKRLWDIKKVLGDDCNTYIRDHTEPIPSFSDIPQGFTCFGFDNTSQKNRALLASTLTEFNTLFSSLDVYQKKLGNRTHDSRITHQNGTCFWPDFTVQCITNKSLHHHLEANGCYLPLNTSNVLSFLEENGFQSILQIFNHHYNRVIESIYSKSEFNGHKDNDIQTLKNHINQHSTLQFLRYDPNVGIKCHIDNLIRSDATVVTIGVGREVVYDLSPILHQEHKLRGVVIRATLPEGSAVVLNDDVRYHWTHAIPYGVEATKYTIIWKLFHTAEMVNYHMENHKYSGILDCDMYSLQM